jgi:hypothetical protein
VLSGVYAVRIFAPGVRRRPASRGRVTFIRAMRLTRVGRPAGAPERDHSVSGEKPLTSCGGRLRG